MMIYLLRHGETAFNAEKRYQGTMDVPLSASGRAELVRAPLRPETVYVSPLSRAGQTAEILFPQARRVVVDDLREMCMGSFEGKTYTEMEHDPDYCAWVAANCESRCPDGELKAGFSDRSCAAFARLVDSALQRGEKRLVIVAHGGTQMAVMERYAAPHREYYSWCGPNAGGYVLRAQAARWHTSHTLVYVRTVQYTRSAVRKGERTC